VFDSYFKPTNKSYLIHQLLYDLIRMSAAARRARRRGSKRDTWWGSTNNDVTPCRRRCDSWTRYKRHVSLSVRPSVRWSLTLFPRSTCISVNDLTV